MNKCQHCDATDTVNFGACISCGEQDAPTCDVCGEIATTWEHGLTGGANVSPFRVCADCGGSPRAGVLDYVEIMPGYDPHADTLSYWVTLCDDWVPNGQCVQSAPLTREQLLMVRADIDDAIATGDRMRADHGASCAFCRGDEGAPVIGSVSYSRDGQQYAGKVCAVCCESIVNEQPDAVVVECSHDWYAHSQYPDNYQQCRHCHAVTS